MILIPNLCITNLPNINLYIFICVIFQGIVLNCLDLYVELTISFIALYFLQILGPDDLRPLPLLSGFTLTSSWPDANVI